MKTVIIALIAAAFLFAQDKDSQHGKDAGKAKNAAKSEPSKGGTSADPVASVIPKGAVRIEPNLYRYTDAQGKTWLYRQLPFGVSKWEDKPVDQPVAPETRAIVVRDLGDSVEFQRQTPFGTSKWVHNKADLTAEERESLANDEARRAADKGKDKQEKK